MTTTLTPSAMNADLALPQRIETRLDQRATASVPRRMTSATTPQHDLFRCQTVNRYRYYGPKVRRAIAASDFLTGCGLAAMGVVMVASGLAMLAMA